MSQAMNGDPILSSSALAALARRADHERYLCALFAPPRRRSALFALIAFNYEIARVGETVSEPLLGRIRLQWWREAIDGLYGGTMRRHPVVVPLAEAIGAYSLERALFERLINAREADLSDTMPPTLSAFEQYAHETAAPLATLMLWVLGNSSMAVRAAAEAVATGFALSGQLRALPYLIRRGRLWLPEDLLQTHGVEQGAVLAGRCEGALRRLTEEVSARARHHFAAARTALRITPPGAAAPFLMATIAETYLDRLARHGHDPFAANLGVGPLAQQLRLTLAFVRRRY